MNQLPLGNPNILQYQTTDILKESGGICDDRDICSPDRVHAEQKYNIDSNTYHEYAMKVELECLYIQICNTSKTHCKIFRNKIFKVIDESFYND